MTEYEVLRFDQWEAKGLSSQTSPPSECGSAPTNPSQTPEPSPPYTPTPEQPEEAGKAASSSPQLRMIKRKAPEVYRLIGEAAQPLPDSNHPSRVVIYLTLH